MADATTSALTTVWISHMFVLYIIKLLFTFDLLISKA